MVRRYNGKQHRKAAHDAVLSQQGANKNQGSLIWTLLLLGLVFCLFNFAFMFVATHFQTLSMLSSRIRRRGSTMSTNGTAAEAATRQQRNDIVVPPEKERIFQILKDAHMDQDVTPEIMKELPTWQQVVDRLGPKPRIYGLDSCQTFKRTIPPAEAFIAPAGAFNSGTNLMAELLIANCFNPARRKKYKSDGVRWQVNWGKHQPPKYRVDQSVYKDKFEMPNENILPVVTIRDPYSWLQSMCRNRYATHWFHEVNFHCPNLIPNDVERKFLPQALDGSYKRRRVDLHHKDPWLVDNVMNTANFTLQHKTVPVYVKYNRETINHDSLAHMWNDWYHDYYGASFPRVMVRYEDLLFYGQEVTTAACRCFGGRMKPRFTHVGDSAKKGSIHINKTSLIDNIIRFGHKTESDRIKGMTEDDVAFAKQTLAQDLMETFAYHHPNLHRSETER